MYSLYEEAFAQSELGQVEAAKELCREFLIIKCPSDSHGQRAYAKPQKATASAFPLK